MMAVPTVTGLLGSRSNCPKSALTWQTKETENSSIGLYFLRHSSWLINSCSIYYWVLYAAEDTGRSCLSLLCNRISRYSVKKQREKRKRRRRFSYVLFCTSS